MDQQNNQQTSLKVIKCAQVFFMSGYNFIYKCVFCEKQFLSNEDYIEHASNTHLEILECEEKHVDSISYMEIYDYQANDSTELDLYGELTYSSPTNANPVRRTNAIHQQKTYNRKDSQEIDTQELVECDPLDDNTENVSLSQSETVGKIDNDEDFYQDNNQEDSEFRPLPKCPYCDRKFLSQHNLEKHKKTHDAVKEFTCPVLSCRKKFSHRGSFVNHVNVHRRYRPFKCKLCPRRYNYRSNIDEHILRCHTLEKPFKCDYCEKRFVSRSERKKHELGHTGEKPYVCDKCGNRFRLITQLKCHLLKHEGIRGFKCDQCDKGFFNRGLLNRHKVTVHAKELIECEICGQKCKHKKTLKEHIKLHLPDKEYICKYCQKPFAQQAGLSSHIKKHHIGG